MGLEEVLQRPGEQHGVVGARRVVRFAQEAERADLALGEGEGEVERGGVEREEEAAQRSLTLVRVFTPTTTSPGSNSWAERSTMQVEASSFTSTTCMVPMISSGRLGS